MERYPYEIVSTWRVAGDIGAVFDVLTDAAALPRWWPEAYQRVREIAAGDPETGRGRLTDITTRGVLPYDVNWRVEVVESHRPTRIRIRASGDLTGEGEWRLRREGKDVVLVYDWRVRVEKPWMRKVEFLLKPAFMLNHNWVMRRGERGLRAELIRRAQSREA